MGTNQPIARKHVSRRSLLRYTLAGAGLTALGGLAQGTVTRAHGAPYSGLKRVVVIFCYGGYDGLNLLVPVTNSAYYSRRSSIAIAPGDALALNGTADYALHPEFDRLQGLWNTDGAVAAIRRVGYPTQNLSHFISQDIYSHGVRSGFGPLPINPSGWIARTANDMGLTATGAVAVGVGRPLEMEGANTAPLLASSLSSFKFNLDQSYPNNHLHRLETLRELVQSFSGKSLDSEASTALGQSLTLAEDIQAAVSNYSSTHDAAYPTTSPGRYLKDIARLIQGGFDSQVFFTGFGGWDNHSNQGGAGGTQASLIERLDSAIGTFVDDLKEMQVWQDTVIVITSEFGRRNFENSSAGTDHGHGNNHFVLGGGVTGGLYGPDISEDDIALTNWMSYDVDFRDIYRDIVTNHLGANGNGIFPETQDFDTALGLFA